MDTPVEIKASSGWSPEQVELLRQYWEVEQLTGGEIARLLGFSRCAIMGKVRRINLSRRHASGPRGPKLPPRANTEPKKRRDLAPRPKVSLPVKPIPAPVPVGSEGICLFDLERHHCRAVIGTGPDSIARFCGQPSGTRLVRGGKVIIAPYCPEHSEIYYNKSSS